MAVPSDWTTNFLLRLATDEQLMQETLLMCSVTGLIWEAMGSLLQMMPIATAQHASMGTSSPSVSTICQEQHAQHMLLDSQSLTLPLKACCQIQVVNRLKGTGVPYMQQLLISVLQFINHKRQPNKTVTSP